MRRHKLPGRGLRRFTADQVFVRAKACSTWAQRIVRPGRMPWRETCSRAVCWKTASTARRALAGDRVWSVGLRRRPKACDGTHPRHRSRVDCVRLYRARDRAVNVSTVVQMSGLCHNVGVTTADRKAAEHRVDDLDAEKKRLQGKVTRRERDAKRLQLHEQPPADGRLTA